MDFYFFPICGLWSLPNGNDIPVSQPTRDPQWDLNLFELSRPTTGRQPMGGQGWVTWRGEDQQLHSLSNIKYLGSQKPIVTLTGAHCYAHRLLAVRHDVHLPRRYNSPRTLCKELTVGDQVVTTDIPHIKIRRKISKRFLQSSPIVQ